jgi:hypothetical protein
VLEWDEQDNKFVVRRSGRYACADVHRALFPDRAPSSGESDVKEAVRKYIRKRHARA